jgi:putative FmdB family regulatory protein
MPLYEYQCEVCEHRFEVIQKFSDPPVETCQKCGGAVRKLLSSPAIQFKGSGWYITDYAKKDSSSKPASSSESKTETKTETNASARSGRLSAK